MRRCCLGDVQSFGGAKFTVRDTVKAMSVQDQEPASCRNACMRAHFDASHTATRAVFVR